MALLNNPITDLLMGDQSEYDDAAMAAINQNKKLWGDLQDLNLEELTPEQYSWLGDLNLEGISGVPDVGYQGVNNDSWTFENDPALREKQMSSLSALDEIVEGGGFTLADKANLSRVQNEAAQGDRGRRDAIMQNMQSRGMGGSGMELLAQLQSSQAATDRTSQAGMDQAGMAQQRALDAIMNQGAMAGGIRSQDFGENAQRAQASDRLKMFNADNMLRKDMYNTDNELGKQQFNAGVGNQAATANWQGKQGMSNQNVDTRNQAQTHNKFTIPTTQYDAKTQKISGMAGANQGIAQAQTAAGDRDAQKHGAVIGGLATIGGGALAASDERKKEDIEELSSEEIRDFLKAVNPKKYKYKNPDTPTTAPGERAGFMLQDVQGTELGNMITEKLPDQSLAYDKDNLQGVMLAALSDLENRKADK